MNNRPPASALCAIFSSYIIDRFLIDELDVYRRPPGEFDKMCLDLYDNWDSFSHYHKSCFTKDSMLEEPTLFRRQWPTLIRQMGCNIAKSFIGNPMSGRGHEWIESYVSSMIEVPPAPKIIVLPNIAADIKNLPAPIIVTT